MPTTLIVSRSFPPVGSVGASIRLVKLMKYIARQNWRFIVLTQHPDHTVAPEMKLSEHMLEEIPPDTQVIRIPAPFTSNRNALSVPDRRQQSLSLSAVYRLLASGVGKILARILPESSLWWGWRVFRQGVKQCRSQNIDLIYITTPPFTPALIGALLSKFTRKPLVLDIKDDWVGSSIFQHKSPWRKAIDARAERWLIGRASAVVLVTEHSYSIYKQRYSAIRNPGKFYLVPNGCDLEEYQAYRPTSVPDRMEQFVILSAAWGYRKDYRDFTPFLLGLSNFLHQSPQSLQQVRVVLLGSGLSPEYDDLIQKTGVRPILEVIDSVDRAHLIDQLARANLLFLIQPVNNTTAISGTLYEYWAAGNAPILLIAEQGASSKLVDVYKLGKCFHFQDIEGIAGYLAEVFQAYQSHHPITIPTNGIEKFDRRTLANQMAEIWQKCLQNP